MMQGLTQQEAKNRLRQDGKNELAEAPKSKPVRISQRAADGGIAVWMDLLNGLSRVIRSV